MAITENADIYFLRSFHAFILINKAFSGKPGTIDKSQGLGSIKIQ
jgi:hypothetical protein